MKKENKSLREELAELEHEQWAHWTRYMLDNLTHQNKIRWAVQLATPYSQLSEKEKDSDRIWADKVLEIFKEKIQNVQRRLKEESKLLKPDIETNMIDLDNLDKLIDKVFEECLGSKLI